MAGFIDIIPEVNVALVTLTGVLLVVGHWLILHGRRVTPHKRLMLTATAVFVLFLALYATRLVVEGPTEFAGHNPDAPEWAAWFYYIFLGVHMALALTTVVLIPIVIRRGLRADWERHTRLAKKVYPMWLVSIAMGITVYFWLFRIWQ